MKPKKSSLSVTRSDRAQAAAGLDGLVRMVLEFAWDARLDSSADVRHWKEIWRRAFGLIPKIPGGVPVYLASPWLDRLTAAQLRNLQEQLQIDVSCILDPPDEDAVVMLRLRDLDFSLSPARRWARSERPVEPGLPPVLTTVYSDTQPITAAKYVVFRLLERVGLERLRICKATNRGVVCRRVFLKVRRKEYCSTACQQREKQRRFRSG